MFVAWQLARGQNLSDIMPEVPRDTMSQSNRPALSQFAGLIRKIETAATRVRDVAQLSPVVEMTQLGARYGNRVFLKREDLQSVYSFKLRGAYNKIAELSPKLLARGVVAASAGNHAQGVALAARHTNTRATIVMPQTTPSIKVDAVRRMGAEVLLRGDTYDEAAVVAMALCEKEQRVWISPYDDMDVIAGQATVAEEIDRQYEDTLDVVFIPCGGGGLLAGMALWLAHVRPQTRVIGVEAADAACASAALKAGRRVVLPEVGLFADGAAVAQVGKIPFKVLRALDNIEMLQVSTEEICAAIKDIYTDTRSIAEPAGALALAGLKRYLGRDASKGQSMLAVHSGANLNFDRLRYIAENTELSERQEALFSVTIPEQPGSFERFCRIIGERSITEFNYRYANVAHAQIFVGVATPKGERLDVMQRIGRAGYRVSDMSDNALAKRHVRHMVGGRTSTADEVLYRVQFPERPGALLNFLRVLGSAWNITLFHYRSHGAAYGRVLIGLQVSSAQRKELMKRLEDTGYRYHAETDNVAYHDFLCPVDASGPE